MTDTRPPRQRLGDSLARIAAAAPHQEAVVFPTERATFSQLHGRAGEFATALHALGVRRDDKVGLLMEPGVDYLAALFGATDVGAVAVPINGRYKSTELRHVIRNSEMRVLLISSREGERTTLTSLLEQALPEVAVTSGSLQLADAPQLSHIVTFGPDVPGGYTTARAFWDGGERVTRDELEQAGRALGSDDIAVIMYTSGTTASPKGAMLSHRALVLHAETTARTRLRIGARDRVWTALPLFHIGGVAFSIACISAGCAYVHCGDFDPGVAVRQLADERITVALPAFETIWLAVLHHPDFDAEALEELRLVFNVGVPERLRGMQELLPRAIQVSGFGATEASSFLTLGVPEDPLDARVNTTGLPLDGMEVRVVDVETGADAAPGQPGEIRYRGYARFAGYYNDPARTAEAIDADGWFHSGDIGTLDDSGRLTYVARLKDMLKVGGENVAAAEIEGFLLQHPAILMAQVVSAPDARYVEVPCAYVQLRVGAEATAEELIDHCLGSIATFKVPRYVRFVEEFPMCGTKVKKHVLRETIAAELAAAGITEAPKLRTRPS